MKNIIGKQGNTIPSIIKWHEDEIKRLKAIKTIPVKLFKSLPLTKQIKLIIQEELKRPSPVYCYNDKRKNGTNRLKFQYKTTPTQFKKIQQRVSNLKGITECIREKGYTGMFGRIPTNRIIIRYKSLVGNHKQ